MKTSFLTNHYIDDIKTLLFKKENFHYLKTYQHTNVQHNNTIFYKKNIKIPKYLNVFLFSKKNIKNNGFRFHEDLLEIATIEELIFGIDITDRININTKQNKCYKRRKLVHCNHQELNIKKKENSYFMFLYKPHFQTTYIDGFKKINDTMYVKKLTNITLNTNEKLSFPKVLNHQTNKIIKNGFSPLLIEEDYFSFNPKNSIEDICQYNENYFNTFQCSYYYYVNPDSWDIILNYYTNLDILILNYTKNIKNNINMIKLNLLLLNLNENTTKLLNNRELF